MTYVPLHQHSLYSLLDGCASVNDIVKRCQEVGITRAAITDHGNIYSLTEWVSATKKAGILGLMGIEFYISRMLATQKTPENGRPYSHLIMIAKNTAGYKQLVKMISRSNSNDCLYYKNRLSLEEIAGIIGKDRGNLIAVTGHLGSTLCSTILTENKETEVWHVSETWKTDGMRHIHWFHEVFGKENVGIEVQMYHKGSGFDEAARLNRELCKLTGALPVATADGHYAFQKQAELQRILLCIQTGKTLDQAMRGGSELSIFYESDKLYLPSREEMKQWGNTDEELDNTVRLTEGCTELDIFSSPKIPGVQLPDGYDSSSQYLRQLCRIGYKRRFPTNTKRYAQQIAERVKYELEVIEKCGLADYFLLIHKITNWCNDNNILTTARGSAVGSMVNYLLGLTHQDPIKYGLIFERYFNEGRVVVKEDGTKIYNLPDFDMDVQASQRQRIIQYLRDEFGEDNVGQIVTFSTLKGRNALKDTCKALGTVSEADVNKITAMMPEEHIIDDDLREIAESFGYRSIIQYCLTNLEKSFAPYAYLNPDGSISGPMAKEFTIARSLEGIVRGIGIHAAGVIINTGKETLIDSMPMTNSAKNDKVIAIDMDNIEKYGGVKIDVLGSSTLDQVATAFHYLNTGEYVIYEKA